jgi:hypothetical protein
MEYRRRIAWILWIPGTALIVGSWIGVIPVTIGWVGFGLALTGTLISAVGSNSPPTRSHDRPTDKPTQS